MARNDSLYLDADTEDNLFDPSELRGRPPASAMSIGAAQIPAAGVAPIAAEEFRPPARPTTEGGVTSYIDEAAKASPAQAAEAQAIEMYAQGYPMKDYTSAIARSRELGDRILKEGGSEKASRLQSAAPDWYKGGEPPAGHSGWATAAGVLGNAMAAPAAQRLKDPNRRAFLKQKDASQVALSTGLSTLLSNLFNHGKQSYDDKQAAALKEAQMMRTIPGGKTAAAMEQEGLRHYIDQAQHAKGQESLEKNRDFNQGIVKMKWDKNDPHAQALAASLIQSGVDPKVVENMSLEDMRLRLPTINTEMGAQARSGQAQADAGNKERQIVLEADVRRGEQLDKDIREAQQARGLAAIPDVEWNNNQPPPPDVVKDVRESWRTHVGFTEALDKMQNIQSRLMQIADDYAKKHGLSGVTAESLKMMGPIAKWAQYSPEAHQLVNDATILRTSIQNLVRSKEYANLGVMQQWEDLKTRMDLPVAGDPTAYLRGSAAWSALRKDADRIWSEHLRSANGRPAGSPDAGPAQGAANAEQRSAERPARPLPPQKIYNTGTRAVEDAPAPALATPDNLGATGTPAPIPGARPPTPDEQAKLDNAKPKPAAASPDGKKHYTISANGKSKSVDYTPAELEKFKADQAERIKSGVITITES